MKKNSFKSLKLFVQVFAMTLTAGNVNATDFKGNESKYIKLCSSSLTNSNKKVCQEFNEYLSKKNKDFEERNFRDKRRFK